MKKQQDRFTDLFNWAKEQEEYWLEAIKIKFAEQILSHIDTLKISRKELACRLGSSPAYITKILRGSSNFTLKSMINIAQALDCELCLDLKAKQDRMTLLEEKLVSKAEPPRSSPNKHDQNMILTPEISKESRAVR